MNSAPTKGGTDRSYLRRRLARDRPDLYEKVAFGEMSAHAAAREAGIVKPTASVRVDSPERVAATLRRHMTPAQLRELRQLLDDKGETR